NIYVDEALANEGRVEVAQERTASLLELALDSSHMDHQTTISKIHDQARDLQVMIKEMQEGMIAYVDQPGASIEEVRWKDNKNAGREAIIDNGAGVSFITEAKKYAAMLDELVKDPVANAQIEDHLEFTTLVWDFEHGRNGVIDSPLMKNYYKNTDAAKGIALAEYVAIAYLLHQ
ncbi:MAG: hypothetical protein KAS29_18160, partial [Bacteroidales bacterium]|nr:hypothetical protein [Bacteroidales bacterium]